MALTREERKQEAVDEFEKLIEKYADLFADGAKFPSVADWVVVVTFDDFEDPGEGYAFRLNRRFQWAHRSVGLLQRAMDEYRDYGEEN